MDRGWMYDAVNLDRHGLKDNFVTGVDEFVKKAMTHPNFLVEGGIRCPCVNCQCIDLATPREVKLHLYRVGFKPNYYVWTEHGEINPNENFGGHSSRGRHVSDEDQLDAMYQMVHDAIRPLTDVPHFNANIGSSESLFSPVRSIVSADEYHPFSNNERDNEDDLSMEWDMDHKNDLLQIVCRYHAQAIPSRGSEFIFHPLEHLQAIQYIRHSVVSLGFRENCLDCSDSTEVNAKLAAAEEALALSVWTTSTTCRVLSLDRLLALVTGVLLEKQVVILCPNLGVLSAVVLSLIPMIRPFQWQSLLLPVLPAKMIDFLDAPVPYIVGIQHKPDDLNMKTANLVEVNVMKDQVKMCHLPRLPQQRDLISQLGPIHAKLSRESSIARKHPIHRCNEVQAETATNFLRSCFVCSRGPVAAWGFFWLCLT